MGEKRGRREEEKEEEKETLEISQYQIFDLIGELCLDIITRMTLSKSMNMVMDRDIEAENG